MKKTLLFTFLALSFSTLFAQETITFNSADGLAITAEIYEAKAESPYILFFHQANASRGEYKESARKFLNLGYNCLVVDLRSGDEINYVPNETAALARREGKAMGFMDSEQDIIAAIDFAYEKSGKPVVLLGSSFSASLVLKVAKGNSKVKAVVAFSPGEFLKPYFNVQEGLSGFDKPVLAASSQREFKYMEEMFASVEKDKKTLFSPKNGPGDHGAKSLWKSCAQNQEYWFQLNIFFQRINAE